MFCPEDRYAVIFPRHFRDLLDAAIIKVDLTRQEAIRARSLSGDLIVDYRGNLAMDYDCLFEWEREDPECYARRAMTYHNAS